jgi:hypothetical protein
VPIGKIHWFKIRCRKYHTQSYAEEATHSHTCNTLRKFLPGTVDLSNGRGVRSPGLQTTYCMWNLRFSRRRVWVWLLSGMLQRVVWQIIDWRFIGVYCYRHQGNNLKRRPVSTRLYGAISQMRAIFNVLYDRVLLHILGHSSTACSEFHNFYFAKKSSWVTGLTDQN